MKSVKVTYIEPAAVVIHFSDLQAGDMFRFTNTDYQNLFMALSSKQYVGLSGSARGQLYIHGTTDSLVDKVTDIEITARVIR